MLLADYHLRVPTDPFCNVQFRADFIEACQTDLALQAGAIEACKADPIFFIKAFVLQVNPNAIGSGSTEFGPFIPWDFQIDAIAKIIWHIENRFDLLIEKSREIGGTWFVLLVFIWYCIFYYGKSFLCISHTEEAVKADHPNSLFWKIRYVLDRLPNWLKGRVIRRKNGFHFTRTSSYMVGTSTTERSGVGGRAVILLDEFSKQKDDYKIWGQTADTGVRIIVGTHYSTETKFFELSQSESVSKMVIHWSQHPDKKKGLYRSGVGPNGYELLDNSEFDVSVKERGSDKIKVLRFPYEWPFITDGRPHGGAKPQIRSPWYDKEVWRRNNDRDVAMHLDIDPRGALSQVFDATRILELQRRCRNPDWQGFLDYTDFAIPNKLMPQKDGEIKLWMQLDNGKPAKGRYVFGCDCATGRATATPSCLSGFNLATGEKVLEYSNRLIEPNQFAILAVAICRLFEDREGRPAKLIWEIPGPGLKFGDKVVKDLRFTHIYYNRNEVDAFPRGQSKTPGWYSMNAGAKRLLVERYKDALYDRQYVNYSSWALGECLQFEYKGDTVEYSGSRKADDPAGAGVNHGDIVVSDALCWWLRVDLMGLEYLNREQPSEYVDVIPFGSIAWKVEKWKKEQREEEAWA